MVKMAGVLGIISAMEAESKMIAQAMENKKESQISCLKIAEGKLSLRDAVVVTGAFGKVSAAAAALLLIERFGAEKIVNVGVAGGLSKNMRQCDFAVAEAFVQHDVDTTAIGDPPGLISGLYTDRFVTNEKMRSVLVNAVKRNGGKTAFTGVFATGDQFVASKERSDFIKNTFSAIACEMEGGAIAQVCHMMDVPFAALRCISDNADGAAGLSYDEFRDKTAALCARIIIDAAGEL